MSQAYEYIKEVADLSVGNVDVSICPDGILVSVFNGHYESNKIIPFHVLEVSFTNTIMHAIEQCKNELGV